MTRYSGYMAKKSDRNGEIKVQHIRYPEEMTYFCPICNEPVRYCFPTAKHDFSDFAGDVREYRYLYCCENPKCTMHGVYFNPAPMSVLPRKQYSLAVWKWIAIEARIHQESVQQIKNRMHDDFQVEISESTIRAYINEIDVYLEGKIDCLIDCKIDSE